MSADRRTVLVGDQSVVGLGRGLDAIAQDGGVATATLLAVIESLSSAAFIVRSDGVVLLENSRGRAEIDAGNLDLQRCLERREDSDHVVVHPLPAGADGLGRALVLRDDPAVAAATRITRAAERWGLSPVQIEVLRLLVRGEANKTIAEQRGCALRTVEVHVSALFVKSRTASRAELIARFWTLA